MQYVIRLAAFYLDFLLISALLHIGFYAAGGVVSSLGAASGIEISPWLLITTLALFFTVFLAQSGLSPGRFSLALLKDRAETSKLPRMAWINLLVGILLFLDATKLLVRWTQMDRPMPFMGSIPEGNTQVVIGVSVGIAFLIAAVLLLRLTALGKWLSAIVLAGAAASVAISWDLYPEAIERMVQARRKLQGIPVREGEIEAMQAYLPTFALVTTSLMLLLVLFSYVQRDD